MPFTHRYPTSEECEKAASYLEAVAAKIRLNGEGEPRIRELTVSKDYDWGELHETRLTDLGPVGEDFTITVKWRLR